MYLIAGIRPFRVQCSRTAKYQGAAGPDKRLKFLAQSLVHCCSIWHHYEPIAIQRSRSVYKVALYA